MPSLQICHHSHPRPRVPPLSAIVLHFAEGETSAVSSLLFVISFPSTIPEFVDIILTDVFCDVWTIKTINISNCQEILKHKSFWSLIPQFYCNFKTTLGPLSPVTKLSSISLPLEISLYLFISHVLWISDGACFLLIDFTCSAFLHVIFEESIFCKWLLFEVPMGFEMKHGIRLGRRV